MKPEKERAKEKKGLEVAIVSSYRDVKMSRMREDTVGEELSEESMNRSLESYFDLCKTLGRVAT